MSKLVIVKMDDHTVEPLLTTTPDVRTLSRKATLLCPEVSFLVQRTPLYKGQIFLPQWWPQ